ncbi:hypothetical protein [Erysipelothrix aquatica]|uniref:hypothetical protein n=1 Tax=Erysipelothrix aquatica TaxID=2683714 RepID=UPI0013596ECD|nr:hypothetical protein [Erysipelothrix aquatica]
MSTIWLDRYEILLNEELNTEMMKKVLGKPHGIVRKLRIDMVAKFNLEGIRLADERLIPTELFLREINRTMKYYENKMNQEAILNKYKRSSK